jgi:putative transposase
MARLARLVVPGYPHHVTQRGVRSIDIFSDDEDRHNYLMFLSEEAEQFGVAFMGWCLMTNHYLCGAQHKMCYVKRQLM